MSLRTVALASRACAGAVAVLIILIGCGLTDITLVSARTVQAAVTATLSAEQLTAVLATMAQDLVGTVPFSCPTVTPAIAGAASYTFNFGPGCAPSPALLVRDVVAGQARVEVNGAQLLVTYQGVVLHGVTLNGTVTVTVSGGASERSFRLSGRIAAQSDGKSYQVVFADLGVRTTVSTSGAVTVVVNGSSSADDSKGTLSLAATNLTFADRSITGGATLSAGGGYFAVAAALGFEPSAGGVRVTGTIAGIAFSFDFAP